MATDVSEDIRGHASAIQEFHAARERLRDHLRGNPAAQNLEAFEREVMELIVGRGGERLERRQPASRNSSTPTPTTVEAFVTKWTAAVVAAAGVPNS
jgi:hypothetical protein